jgi:hypothetical protein
MNRPICAVVLAAAALAAGACRSSPSEGRVREIDNGALIHRTTTGYHLVVSAHRGRIGYLKDELVSEGGGPAYPWKYVYDNDWKELGFVNQFGVACKLLEYAPAEQASQNEWGRGVVLPSDGIQVNVLRMFDIDPSTDDVTFPAASHADIAGGNAKPAPATQAPAKAPETK